VRVAYQNVQDQQRVTWPASFVVARAYLDQLERSRGLAADRVPASAADGVKVRTLSGVVRELAR